MITHNRATPNYDLLSLSLRMTPAKWLAGMRATLALMEMDMEADGTLNKPLAGVELKSILHHCDHQERIIIQVDDSDAPVSVTIEVFDYGY